MKVATKRSKNENKKESIEQKEQINTTQSERSTEEDQRKSTGKAGVCDQHTQRKEESEWEQTLK